MEKYGTPQKKTEEGGTVKVAAGAIKDCCRKVFETLEKGKEATCECGNRLISEKA